MAQILTGLFNVKSQGKNYSSSIQIRSKYVQISRKIGYHLFRRNRHKHLTKNLMERQSSKKPNKHTPPTKHDKNYKANKKIKVIHISNLTPSPKLIIEHKFENKFGGMMICVSQLTEKHASGR